MRIIFMIFEVQKPSPSPERLSFEEVLGGLRNPLYVHAQKYLLSEDADDWVQEVMVEALKRREQLHGIDAVTSEKCMLTRLKRMGRKFLNSVCEQTSLCNIDSVEYLQWNADQPLYGSLPHWQRRIVSQLSTADNSATVAVDVMIFHDEVCAVMEEELPEPSQTVLHMISEGNTVEDVASVLGMSKGAVASRLFRARKLLREKFADRLTKVAHRAHNGHPHPHIGNMLRVTEHPPTSEERMR